MFDAIEAGEDLGPYLSIDELQKIQHSMSVAKQETPQVTPLAAARKEFDDAWAALCKSKRSMSGGSPQALRYRAACRALRDAEAAAS